MGPILFKYVRNIIIIIVMYNKKESERERERVKKRFISTHTQYPHDMSDRYYLLLVLSLRFKLNGFNWTTSERGKARACSVCGCALTLTLMHHQFHFGRFQFESNWNCLSINVLSLGTVLYPMILAWIEPKQHSNTISAAAAAPAWLHAYCWFQTIRFIVYRING